MKKKFLYFFCCICILSFSSPLFAANTKLEKDFTIFVKKIEIKYSLEHEIQVFQEFQQAIEDKKQNKLSQQKIKLLDELSELNNEILFEKEQELYSSQADQIQKEKLLREKLEKELASEKTLPAYISPLLSAGKELFYVNSSFEYVSGEDIQKIIFTNYYPLSSENSSNFKNKTGIIIKNSDESQYWFVQDYSKEKKIPYSKLWDTFLAFITDETNFIEENNSYYGFVYSRFSYLEDMYGVYTSNMKKLAVNPDIALLYRDASWRYNFITEFKKVFLASKETLVWIPGKGEILLYLRDDAKDGLTNSDTTLQNIKKQAVSLSLNKTRDQKIESIYAWVIEYLQYSKVIDFENAEIFSWLASYENKEWVCTGYAKLVAYMLAFAWVSDVKMVLWDVIDAQDFPQIWHAWLNIGEYYYDPTFDDPIGNTKSRAPSQYRYYKLPEDLFYTNRYDRGETPESLKSTDMLYRQTRVDLNLSKLVDTYQNKWYNLLKPFDFRKKYNIAYNKDITPQVLKDIIPYYEVDGKTFSFVDESGNKKYIRWVNYYTIDNTTAETALMELDFDTNDLYLFAWKKENGDIEYRLSYDVIF